MITRVNLSELVEMSAIRHGHSTTSRRPIMVVILAVLFRLLRRTRAAARGARPGQGGRAGSMEGHAAMDVSVAGDGPFLRRPASRAGFDSVAQVSVME